MVGALVGGNDNDPKFWCLMLSCPVPGGWWCLTIKSLFSNVENMRILRDV